MQVIEDYYKTNFCSDKIFENLLFYNKKKYILFFIYYLHIISLLLVILSCIKKNAEISSLTFISRVNVFARRGQSISLLYRGLFLLYVPWNKHEIVNFK